MSAELIAAAWCALMSALLFAVMGLDKRRARRGVRRVPEKRLFAVALLGGAFGGWLGMYAFHHKTRRWYFRVGFPLMAAVQALMLLRLRGLV